MLWSPTIRAALIAGTPWLDVHCPGCGASRAIDLRTVDRHPLASVGLGARPALVVVPGLGADLEDTGPACSAAGGRRRCLDGMRTRGSTSASTPGGTSPTAPRASRRTPPPAATLRGKREGARPSLLAIPLADRYARGMNQLGQFLVAIVAILIAGTLAYFVASFVLNW